MAKILLVEDEINIASFIERGLKEFGHSVTVCHDGDTGWKILQDEPFDLLILDIIMPKINDIRKQVRKIPELTFFIDDSLDYIENIDNLLKK